MDDPFRLQPRLTCEACGRTGAYPFDGGPLCADCVHERGSCCAGEDRCPSPESGSTPAPDPAGG